MVRSFLRKGLRWMSGYNFKVILLAILIISGCLNNKNEFDKELVVLSKKLPELECKKDLNNKRTDELRNIIDDAIKLCNSRDKNQHKVFSKLLDYSQLSSASCRYSDTIPFKLLKISLKKETLKNKTIDILSETRLYECLKMHDIKYVSNKNNVYIVLYNLNYEKNLPVNRILKLFLS